MLNRIRYIYPENIRISLIIAYAIVPIVSRFISTYLTTYFYMLLILYTLSKIIFSRSIHGVDEYMTLLIPFICYEGLTFFIKESSILEWGYQVLLFLLPINLGYYILYDSHMEIEKLSKIICYALIITVITSVIGLIQYPSAARILATIESSQNEMAIVYDWHNIGGYDFVYTIVLLYPILIYAYKRKKISLIFTIIAVMGILMLILLAEYTIALLFFGVSSLLFFTKRDLRIRDVFIITIIAIIAIWKLDDVFSEFFRQLSNIINSKDISERLLALSGGVAGLEASDDNRILLYQKSINTFLQHPLFGSFIFKEYHIGGHSAILDCLAQFGIIGAGLLFFIYRKIYRIFVRPFAKSVGYGYLVWTFLQTIILSVLNTGFWIYVLTLYVPILACEINEMDGKENENSLGS